MVTYEKDEAASSLDSDYLALLLCSRTVLYSYSLQNSHHWECAMQIGITDPRPYKPIRDDHLRALSAHPCAKSSKACALK